MPPKRFEMLTAAGASNLSVRALLAAGEGPDLVREAKEHVAKTIQRIFRGRTARRLAADLKEMKMQLVMVCY